MEKPRLKAEGYLRLSMRVQIDGHSLDAQKENVCDYAASHRWNSIKIYTVVGTLYGLNPKSP